MQDLPLTAQFQQRPRQQNRNSHKNSKMKAKHAIFWFRMPSLEAMSNIQQDKCNYKCSN